MKRLFCAYLLSWS